MNTSRHDWTVRQKTSKIQQQIDLFKIHHLSLQLLTSFSIQIGNNHWNSPVPIKSTRFFNCDFRSEELSALQEWLSNSESRTSYGEVWLGFDTISQGIICSDLDPKLWTRKNWQRLIPISSDYCGSQCYPATRQHQNLKVQTQCTCWGSAPGR